MAHFSSSETGKADFVLLDEVSTDSFMQNLKLRYEKAKIYTYIGEVVVSVNPYRPMNIYERSFIQDYKGKEMYEREPHIYALADAAYRNMRRTSVDCCIIISGMNIYKQSVHYDIDKLPFIIVASGCRIIWAIFVLTVHCLDTHVHF